MLSPTVLQFSVQLLTRSQPFTTVVPRRTRSKRRHSPQSMSAGVRPTQQRRLATVHGKSQNISGISAAEITRKKQVFCVDNLNPDVSVEFVVNLKVMSYNMHCYFQGCPALDELIPVQLPDVILLQKHWLTPAKLSLFDDHFVDYFAFGCSAMSDCIELGMLKGRPYGGVMCLVAKKLRKFATTIHCDERFTVVKIFNCLFFNVYLPCVGSFNRLQIATSILDLSLIHI